MRRSSHQIRRVNCDVLCSRQLDQIRRCIVQRVAVLVVNNSAANSWTNVLLVDDVRSLAPHIRFRHLDEGSLVAVSFVANMNSHSAHRHCSFGWTSWLELRARRVAATLVDSLESIVQLGRAPSRTAIGRSNRGGLTGELCATNRTGKSDWHGSILSPYVGTGTTVMAAEALGRTGIGLDLSAAFLRIADWRINHPEQRSRVRERSNLEAQGSLL